MTAIAAAISHMRDIMWRGAGVFRDRAGLERAVGALADLDEDFSNVPSPTVDQSAGDSSEAAMVRAWCEARNMLLICRLVALAALRRQESRGAHYREDYPASSGAWQRHQTLTINDLGEENRAHSGAEVSADLGAHADRGVDQVASPDKSLKDRHGNAATAA